MQSPQSPAVRRMRFPLTARPPLRALYKEPCCETLKWSGPRTLALPAALALRAVSLGVGPFRARWALLWPMPSTPSANVTKLTDYLWLVESAVLGTGAAMLIFNGMPVLGAAVAIVACLEDD